ncbi:hypothetical protein UB37_17425 [Photobacterium iliopiscarium]|nr:hypothetical protein UB37_17425 [Photobacterium iliopiscarium]
MLTFKRFSSNYSIYKKIALQLIVFFIAIYIIFQLLIITNFFSKDTLNVIHAHSVKLNILLIFTLFFIFLYIVNRINKWFVNPLKQLKDSINNDSDIHINDNIHDDDISDVFKSYQRMIKKSCRQRFSNKFKDIYTDSRKTSSHASATINVKYI